MKVADEIYFLKDDERNKILDTMWDDMGTSDGIRKEIFSLAKDLPKTGRLSYGSKYMEPYVGRVDKIIGMLLGYDGRVRRADNRFYRELEKREMASIFHHN